MINLLSSVRKPKTATKPAPPILVAAVDSISRLRHVMEVGQSLIRGGAQRRLWASENNEVFEVRNLKEESKQEEKSPVAFEEQPTTSKKSGKIL